MGLSICTKLQLIHCHAQEKTIDNRFPRNEIGIHSRINCKQMASVNVKMVDHLIIAAGFLEQHRGMDGRYIKKLECSHTLQSIETPSVTEAIN